MDGTSFEAPRPEAPVAPHQAEPRDDPPPALPLERQGITAIVDALLRSPTRLYVTASERSVASRLLVIVLVSLAGTGVAMASWSGGLQLALVPVKLALVALVTALVCMPSLHVLSALSGSPQSIRQTGSALSMGVALAAVLALALAPIAWVLSAATSSLALAGALHLSVLLVAAGAGLGLVRRALASSAGTTIRGLGAWSFMFVVVALQLATTLRPMVGPFDGLWPHERTFFLAHFADCLGGS